MTNTRKIFKSAVTSQHAVRDILSMVFAQELLMPSPDIFIVAPWISNVVIFDSTLGQFSTLNPEWAKRQVRLAEVLVSLASAGTTIHIHTRPDDHNKIFQRRLSEAIEDVGLTQFVRWSGDNPVLHTKGVLTSRVLVDGSMNLTESGVALNEEAVTISFEPDQIAAARLHFEDYER